MHRLALELHLFAHAMQFFALRLLELLLFAPHHQLLFRLIALELHIVQLTQRFIAAEISLFVVVSVRPPVVVVENFRRAIGVRFLFANLRLR